MAIGSIQVANCCVIPPPPSTTFNRWDLSFSITTTGNYSAQLETNETMNVCGGPCCLQSFVTSIVQKWDSGTREYISVTVDNVINGSASWTYSSENIETYDSSTLLSTPLKYYRPGSNVLLKTLTGSDRDFRGRRYLFTNTSASYSSTSPSITFGPSPPFAFCQGVPPTPNQCGPCYESTTKTFTVWTVAPGATTSSSPSLQPLSVSWINQTNIDIKAFRISLTASGSAQGRWDLQCISGTIRVVSDTGIVREASGSLSSCVTALEAGGYIDAGVFLDVTSDALSSDLKDASFTLGQFPCSVDLLFAAKGDYLSPKSGITGWTGVPFGDSNPENDSYENTEAGFRAWLEATRKPGICQGPAQTCGVKGAGQFDSVGSITSAWPTSHYLYFLYPYGGETPFNCSTSCFPTGWQINPANTTALYEAKGGTPTVSKYRYTIVSGGFGFVDKCDSSDWPEGTSYEDECLIDLIDILTNHSFYPATRPIVNWSRTISGSWNLS